MENQALEIPSSHQTAVLGCKTALAASAAALPPTMQPARQPPWSLSLGSFGVATRTMLKSLFILLLSVLAATGGDTLIPPLKAIEEFGGIAVSDGSSFYTFSKDGSFESGPLGMSGRTMNGRWVKDADGRLIATVKLGWVNGLSSGGQYRRIVFSISHVSKRVEPAKPRFGTTAELFDSYFFIDEMTPIPKPTEGISK